MTRTHTQAMARVKELRAYYESLLRTQDPARIEPSLDWITQAARRRYRLALYVLGFRNAARSVKP